MKLLSVFSNQLSVIINILIVDVDVLVIAVNKLTGGLNTCLKTRDSFTESLGSNKHITRLGDLKLISVLTEESTVRVESVHGFGELGSARIGW